MKNEWKSRQLKYVVLPDGSRTNRLIDAFEIGKIISFVGAGGKTSTIFELASELASGGNTVCISTTTRMYPFAEKLKTGISCVGELDEKGKLKGPEDIDRLKAYYDYLLVEADGSRGLPLKAPASHEPVITKESNQVLVVVGLSSVGRKIGEVCHRVEYVCDILNKKENDKVTEEDIATILMSDRGLHKNVGNRDYVVILNQADGIEDIEMGKRISGLLPENIKCLITAYCEDNK